MLLPLLLALTLSASTPSPPDPSLLTVAEKSDFRATAHYADVVALLDRLAELSPLARRAELGTSGEGRSLPMLIVSDPPVSTPAEARTLAAEQGKLIVLAIGNIHAGEVDGKEALPMLARDLLGLHASTKSPSNPPDPLLQKLIFIIAPIYNADGNERVSKDNRPGQIGPDEGMGIRENAAGLDLNRDFIKVESPEGAALVKAFVEWDPHIFIDCHTTNGSYHRYVLTYAGPKAPAGDSELIRWSRESFFPAITRAFDRPDENGGGIRSFWYGSFEGAFSDAAPPPRGHTRWETFPAEARYGTTYFGLRNRLGILSEAYSYSSFKDRVLATRDFVHTILNYAADHRAEIADLLKAADARAIKAGEKPKDRVIIRTKAAPWPGKVTVLGYEEDIVDGKNHSTGKPTEYSCELWDRFEEVASVARPWGYLLKPSPEMDRIVAKLRQHGIAVSRLDAPTPSDLDVESYTVSAIEPASRAYQNHVLVKVDVTASPARQSFEAGTYLVQTAQPLGSLAVYLLEPACEDGLATWNYDDPWLKVGESLPILRVLKPAALQAKPLP